MTPSYVAARPFNKSTSNRLCSPGSSPDLSRDLSLQPIIPVSSGLLQDTMVPQDPELQPSSHSVDLPLQPSPVLAEPPSSSLPTPLLQSTELSPGRPARVCWPKKMYDPSSGTYGLPNSS